MPRKPPYPENFKIEALEQIRERGQPKDTVTAHSDQGCPFARHEWQAFLGDCNLVSSMNLAV